MSNGVAGGDDGVPPQRSLVPQQQRQQQFAVTNVADLQTLGGLLAKSGFFKDATDASKACAKILAGHEYGLKPFGAMQAFYIVQGRVTMSANTVAGLLKKSGRYDYDISWDDKGGAVKGCTITFYDVSQPNKRRKLGDSSFTEEDAKKAGLLGKEVWRQYPRNMYFARAMTNGARWYAPDVFVGGVYTPEELGEDGQYAADEQGEFHARSESPGIVEGEVISPPASPEELGVLRGLLERKGVGEDRVLSRYEVATLEALNRSQVEEACEVLRQRKDKK